MLRESIVSWLTSPLFLSFLIFFFLIFFKWVFNISSKFLVNFLIIKLFFTSAKKSSLSQTTTPDTLSALLMIIDVSSLKEYTAKCFRVGTNWRPFERREISSLVRFHLHFSFVRKNFDMKRWLLCWIV